jgi:hypothetical protein
VIVLSDPDHHARGRNTREHGQASEHRSRSTDAAVAGNFDQFTGSGASVEVGDGRKQPPLVVG